MAENDDYSGSEYDSSEEGGTEQEQQASAAAAIQLATAPEPVPVAVAAPVTVLTESKQAEDTILKLRVLTANMDTLNKKLSTWRAQKSNLEKMLRTYMIEFSIGQMTTNPGAEDEMLVKLVDSDTLASSNVSKDYVEGRLMHFINNEEQVAAMMTDIWETSRPRKQQIKLSTSMPYQERLKKASKPSKKRKEDSGPPKSKTVFENKVIFKSGATV